jgi:hypothetical protein
MILYFMNRPLVSRVYFCLIRSQSQRVYKFISYDLRRLLLN